MRESQSDIPSPVEIHRGRRHVVLRVDAGGGRSQIRKTVRQRAMIRNAPARLRHEYAMLRVLDASAVPHVPRPIGLEETNSHPTLVLEDAGPRNLGERLRHRPLPIDVFLDLAAQVAEIVASLHRHRVIHRDINPSNIVIAADGRTLTLVDFGLATHVVAVAQRAAAGELAGTLPYVAPEQTGRMDRPLDHRADLYSLGATFYEMLTGTPPFASEDPAELVHAHLAWTPVPPTARNPAVPEVLSSIVLRLLAKMPEQRYQSGEALLADLREALRQWEATRTILPFELGRADVPQSLLAPTRLQGRAAELEALGAAVERARGGACELVLLSGPAGIGKSRLVEALRGGLEGRCRFLAGKADPLHGNVPYGLLAGPLRAFFRGLLREPAHLVDEWRGRVVEALGPSGGLIGDLIPELRLLIGEAPLPSAVGPLATENRFRLALQGLVLALGGADAPLVLFLDDLQWADAPSLALLERLASAPDAHHALLLAACRDDEGLASEGPVGRMLVDARGAGAAVQTMPLGPLDLALLTSLCAETLRCTPERARPLAELVLRKTAGNPFFAERFLRLLYRSGLLVFDQQRGDWSWDLAGAEALGVTDNVVDLMVGAVSRLPDETTALLTTAACMRERIDLELLAAVVEQPVGDTASRLWSALREGLLVPARADARADTGVEDEALASYRFVHDRVRQAAYSLLGEVDKRRRHLAIGRQLLTTLAAHPTDEELFDVVDQLDRGADLIADEAERLRLAELHLRAAARARTSGALGPALEYARHGIGVLPPATRAGRRPLWLALYRQATECAYCTGDAALGEALFAQALEHAETPLEQADLHAVRTSGESSQGAAQAALEWGSAGLRLLGFALPDELSREGLECEVAAILAQVAGRPIAGLVELPPMRDPRPLAALDLLRRMASTAQLWNYTIWSLIQVREVALSLAHGNAPPSAGGYVGFGLVLLDFPCDDGAAEAFGRLGVELAQRLGDPTTEAWVLTKFYSVS